MTFSFSKGLMVDWSLAGGGVRFDAKKNAEVYGKEVTPAEVLSGSVPVPPEFEPVVQKLNQARHGGRKEGRGGVGCCPRAASTERLLAAERAGLCAAAAGGRHQEPPCTPLGPLGTLGGPSRDVNTELLSKLALCRSTRPAVLRCQATGRRPDPTLGGRAYCKGGAPYNAEHWSCRWSVLVPHPHRPCHTYNASK